MKKRPAKETIERLRKLDIPNKIKTKIRNSKELSEIESEILHSHRLEFVRSSKRKSFLREYTGGIESRMRNLELANIKRGL